MSIFDIRCTFGTGNASVAVSKGIDGAVEPVHDLVHVDVIGQLADGLQGFLFSELYGGLPESLPSVKRLGRPKAVSLVCLLCSAIMPPITRKG